MNNSDEIYVAELGGANKDLIMNNPAFARTRENMSEMTPRSYLAKDIKRELGDWTISVCNRYLIGDINKALRIIQKKDPDSARGLRIIPLSQYRDVLNIPVYYSYKPLRDIMNCTYTVVTGADRKSVTVSLTNFTPREQIKPPPEATHFQFCLSIGVVCEIVYDPKNKVFNRVYSATEMMNCRKEFESEFIPVNGVGMGDLTFTVALPDHFQLKEDMTVLRTFGIVFGKNRYDMEPLKRDRGSVEFLGAI
jgi:hypothetical protein